MDRLYKNKKDYYEGVTIDGSIVIDRELYCNAMLASIISEINCFNCKHFREWDFFCKAYPDGVPDEILNGDVAHTEIRPDQKGKAVFEKKE